MKKEAKNTTLPGIFEKLLLFVSLENTGKNEKGSGTRLKGPAQKDPASRNQNDGKMKKEAKNATLLGIFGNLLLFILKAAVGISTGSLAIISDAFNSGTDIIAAYAVHKSVQTGSKKADQLHPFGHTRAEPIAALVVAILISIVGVEVVILAIQRIIMRTGPQIGVNAILVLIFTIAMKGGMYLYTFGVAKKTKSVAIHALSLDHRIDILISITALIGVVKTFLGSPISDALFALLIGAYITKSGYKMAMKNMDYLMGSRPEKEVIEKMRKKALSVKGVSGINDLRAQYVGTKVQVEIHIEIDKRTDLEKAHGIGKQVEKAIEEMEEINRAFIHIDPV